MPTTRRMATRRRRQQRRLPGAVRVALLAVVALIPFLLLLTPERGDTLAALTPAPSPVPHSTPRPSAPHRAPGAGAAIRRHTVRYDRYSFIVDGRRVVLFGGEYQFWRTPSPDRWPAVLAEMRAAGLNTVSVGVSWQYHSPAPGVYDFSGIRDLGRFLDDAAAAGLYVIARPGPVYNAESSASNLPGWLLTETSNLRANDGYSYCGAAAYSPTYAAAYRDWYRHVLPIIAARQLTRGRGTVIAMQIENEYSPRCGSQRYMRDLHDLARRAGITVPLIANNNACCVATGAWHTRGDDGQPIVDIPAEDDYPCTRLCPPSWDGSIFSSIDTLEKRMRGAGVTAAPIAVAELQGGYFTGWNGRTYKDIGATMGPAFSEVLDGSVLGQGATMVSIYMVAGGTTWGYLGGPNTDTSYDYAAPIHEWGEPGPTYGALKRTGMFVDAFGDLLGATERTKAITASDPRLLYAARQTVDGPQHGAQLIVLRNTDPTHSGSTRLTLPLDGHAESIPQASPSITLPPHTLSLLVANYHLGPFYLRYSTSRPLTHAMIGGDEVAVLYGIPGTTGETALTFARRPSIVHLDTGIAARYDAARHELLLSYRHDERARHVVLSSGGHKLVLILTGPNGAAHTWRTRTRHGPILAMGPSMVTAQGNTLHVSTSPGTTMATSVWGAHGLALVPTKDSAARVAPAKDGAARVASAGSGDKTLAGQGLVSRVKAQAQVMRQSDVSYNPLLGATSSLLSTRSPPLRLPALTRWRFMPGSPEILPSYDDAAWTPATETATSNPNVPSSDTLLADDYGYHYGFVWYRGSFIGKGTENGLRLFARNSYSVWLNGRYLGSSSLDNDLKDTDDALAVHAAAPSNATYTDGITFPIRPGMVHVGAANTIAVLVESLGHNIGFANGELARSPMGILSAQLVGPSTGFTAPTIKWKLQGGLRDTGGRADAKAAAAADSLRSPLNASGLYGERNGWYLPGFDDSAWPTVTAPDNWAARGLHLQGIGWYRTTFKLNLPAGVDAPIGLTIPHAQDKVVIWLNGLLIGRYWEQAGPQHTFYLPAGLLREHGRNTLALAVWNRGHDGGLTGGVFLQPYTVGAQATLRVTP